MTCQTKCLCNCGQMGCGCHDAKPREYAEPIKRMPVPEKPTELDLEIPQGDPDAEVCRHCKRRRIRLAGGAIICRHCDMLGNSR